MPTRRSKTTKARAKPRAKKPRRVTDSLTVSVLQSTLESTADGILVVDDTGTIVAHNTRFEEMWGLSAQHIADNDSATLIGRVKNQLINPDAFVAGIPARYAHPQSDSVGLLRFRGRPTREPYTPPPRVAGHPLGPGATCRDCAA